MFDGMPSTKKSQPAPFPLHLICQNQQGSIHMTDPRYPIGKFQFDGPLTDAQRAEHLNNIEQAPDRLRSAIAGLTTQQLDTPYRDGGWTVRQVVHHVPESHMNS